MPSGLYADKSSGKNAIIRASYTLSFQQPKLAFLLAENEPFCGKVVILDIGLSKQYSDNEKSIFELIDKNQVAQIYKPRKAICQQRQLRLCMPGSRQLWNDGRCDSKRQGLP